MAEPIKISTGKYRKAGKVNIDGHLWTVKLPGAATEMKMMQAQRRLTLLETKVQAGTATEEDLDKYDEYESTVYNIFKNMFTDDTQDNSSVKQWVDETPLAIIVQVFEDIKEQANGDGRSDTTESA